MHTYLENSKRDFDGSTVSLTPDQRQKPLGRAIGEVFSIYWLSKKLCSKISPDEEGEIYRAIFELSEEIELKAGEFSLGSFTSSDEEQKFSDLLFALEMGRVPPFCPLATLVQLLASGAKPFSPQEHSYVLVAPLSLPYTCKGQSEEKLFFPVVRSNFQNGEVPFRLHFYTGEDCLPAGLVLAHYFETDRIPDPV